jgi:PIN domain nuclease of toxin-antitoxin system
LSQIAVTDTHALIWHALGRGRRLGKAARGLFERADRGEAAVYVPVLVLVELLEANRRGTIRLPGGGEDWVRRLADSGAWFPVDLSVGIVLRAERLHSIPERGDRLIAATAAELDYPLVTRDPAIAAAAGVRLLW